MGRRLAFWVLLALSCAQLDGVDPNLCGNQVHDADEDCDDAHVPGSTCLPAGVVGECRYGCDAELSCPAGFVCGDADGICRRPSGAFTAIRTYPAIGARDVALTNFDGDDTAEVTLIELDRLRIHYADEAGQVIDTHVEVFNPRPLLEEDATFGNPLPDQIPDVFPLLRDFSGDGIDDAVLAFEPGLSVVLGRGDRTLVPLAFPSFGFPAIVQDAAATGLDLRPARAGDELFAIVEAFNVSVIIALDDDTAELINTAAKKPSEVILPMASGNVMAWQGDPPMPHVCEEAVFAYQGEDEVLVYAAAQPDPDSPFPDECKYVPTTPRRIELPPGGVVVRAPKVLDYDGDGSLDLLVLGTRNGVTTLFLGYGLGDGHFDSTSPTTTTPDDELAELPHPFLVAFQAEFPVEFYDLNLDGVIDFVFPTAIVLSKPTAPFYSVARIKGGAPWTGAGVADFNGDGVPDIAAYAAGEARIDMFTTAGQQVNDFAFTLDSDVVDHTWGDFDGDMVTDLALVERDVEVAGSSTNGVSIIFGAAFGAPSPPRRVGHLSGVKALYTGQNHRWLQAVGGETIDATDDIAVLVQGEQPGSEGRGENALGSLRANIFVGRTDRAIRAPLTIIQGGIAYLDTSSEDILSRHTGYTHTAGRFASDSRGDLMVLSDSAGNTRRVIVVPRIEQFDQVDSTTVELSERLFPTEGSELPDVVFRDGRLATVTVPGRSQQLGVLMLPIRKPDDPEGRETGSASESMLLDIYGFDETLPDDAATLRVVSVAPNGPEVIDFDISNPVKLGLSPAYPGFNIGRVAVGDVTGDGIDDVLVAGSDAQGPGVLVLAGNDSLLPQAGQILRLDVNLRDFALIEIDGDPALEVVMLGAGEIAFFDALGSELVELPALRHTVDGARARLQSGDFQHDGVADLVIVGGGQAELWLQREQPPGFLPGTATP